MRGDRDPDPGGPGRITSPSDAVEGILRRALAQAEEGEWEDVHAFLLGTLDDHPEDPYLLCWLGLAERELGFEGAACERFRAALAGNVEDPVLLATAGNALAGFDDPAAEPALRTAALLAPDLPQARWMYGAYLSREGLVPEALRELDAAVALDPEDAVIHLERGIALSVGGNLEEAAAAFATSAELEEGEGWALLLLGLARVQLGEIEDAVFALEAGARERPDDLEAQLLAALALSASGWEDRAWEMLERGRLHAEAGDLALIDEVEVHLEEGPEFAAVFLSESLGPSAFRERILQRP